MREEHRRTRLEARCDLFLPHTLLHVIWDEHRDDLRAADGVGNRRDLEPGFLGRRARRASVPEADDDLHARVAQVERVRVALAAEADHGNLAVEELEIAVAMDRCH